MNRNFVGQIIQDQYRVDEFIASGSTGVVFRVFDLRRNVPLAMKVLNIDLAEDATMLKMFKRDATAIKKLAHPNIVSFYGLDLTAQQPFLLMSFIDGPTLKDILSARKNQPLPQNEILIYMRALCAALGYAHEKGVVHCDVKPANAMIDKGGRIYLADFGIARHANSTTTTMAGAGTPAYMSPEQVRGDTVTNATDIYALGVILFEMFTGQRPFRGNERGTETSGATDSERIRYGHLQLQAPDPSSLNPSISPAVSQVILKALTKDPTQRYRSTTELMEALCAASGVAYGQIPDRIDPQRMTWPSSERVDYAQETPQPRSAPPSLQKIAARPQLIWVAGAALVVIIGLLFIIKPSSTHLPPLLTSTATTVTGGVPAPMVTATPAPRATATSAPSPTEPQNAVVPLPNISWSTPVTVDPNAKVGMFNTLIMDQNDIPYIAYLDDPYDSLRIVSLKYGNWTQMYMPGAGKVNGWLPSFALDSHGKLYLDYYQKEGSSGAGIFYTGLTSGAWESPSPVIVNSAGWKKDNAYITSTSLAFDPNDNPFIVYLDKTDGFIKEAFRSTNGPWNEKSIAPAFNHSGNIQMDPYGAKVALAIDRQGNHHIAYSTEYNGLQFILLRNSNGNPETIDATAGMFSYPSLALDAGGNPYISFYNGSKQCLELASRQSNNWNTQFIDCAGSVGKYSSIKIDSSGTVHISYFDEGHGGLKYVRVSGGIPDRPMVVDQTVDQGTVGMWSSLALDSKDIPHISYIYFFHPYVNSTLKISLRYVSADDATTLSEPAAFSDMVLIQNKIESVAEFVQASLNLNSLSELSNLVGSTGAAVFVPYGTEFSSPGYNNADKMVQSLETVFRNQMPQCLGYDPTAGASPVIYLQGDQFNLPNQGVKPGIEQVLGFGFIQNNQNWELAYITFIPKAFWPDKNHLHPCSS